MTRNMTATQARKKFYDVIKTAKKPGMFVTITLDGLPEVVVMSHAEFEEMKSGKRPRNTISLDALKKKLKI